MYIIIAGGGMVGGRLARKLLDNKHDVVLVEPDKEICDNLYARMGVLAINGNATSIVVLKDAGIDKADIFVAATGSDADHLACSILAKSLGVSDVLVRMRNRCSTVSCPVIITASTTRVRLRRALVARIQPVNTI